MKNSQLETVAQELGVSKSTVSKAVNHCAGIGSELREQILLAAQARGLQGKPSGHCEAYVILPEIPVYFWRTVYHELSASLKALGIRTKYNLYSRLGDEQAVRHYLDEAEALDARVILIAARVPGLEKRLSMLAKRRAVFSLCAVCPAVNVFTFASDGKADGRMLAERCLSEHPHASSILLLGNDPDRIAGFSEAAHGISLHQMPLNLSSKASQLAAEMARLPHSFDIAICLDGLTDIVCSALKKCHSTVPCYGFESPTIEPRYGLPAGEVHQDLPSITQAAALAAHRYLREGILPSRKMALIPSRYVQRCDPSLS